MIQLTADTINKQGKAEDQPESIIFGGINMKTTINDLDASPDEFDPELDNDDAGDKSYLTSDDSTVEGDHDVDKDDPIINDDYLQKKLLQCK